VIHALKLAMPVGQKVKKSVKILPEKASRKAKESVNNTESIPLLG